MEINKDIERILFTEKELSAIADNIAGQINTDYKGKELLVVGVLKGSVIFLADIFRRLSLDCRLDFITASSYGSAAESSGRIIIKKDIDADIKGKHLLLCEDILDTGNTLYYLCQNLRERGAESIKICALLDKPSRRQKPVKPDYCGAQVPDAFIVGYGLDYDERYRNLPYIGILKPEIYR